MSASKKILGATEAAILLQREFARLKPAACQTCKAPLPFWGPGVVSGNGYWYVKAIPPCPHQCGRLISRLWAEITLHYEIIRSGNESGRARFEGAIHEAKNPAPMRGQFKKVAR